jgi:hypothetical protein
METESRAPGRKTEITATAKSALVGGVRAIAWSIAVATPCAITPASAQTPALIEFSVGKFDFLQNRDDAGQIGVEYRGTPLIGWLRPMLGAMGTTDSSGYVYGGVALEIWFGTKWVLTPSAAAGAYGRGQGLNLGSTVEFRTGATLGYRFNDNSRLSVGFHHLSNAGITDRNPGSEMLTVNYAIPFDRVFRRIGN